MHAPTPFIEYCNGEPMSPQLRAEALEHWRRAGTPPLGITNHELAQWVVLAKRHGDRFNYSALTICDMRLAPPPTPKAIADTARVPGLSAQRALFCRAVSALTVRQGLCTLADLAHLLWGEQERYPAPQIFDVLACRVNAAARAAQCGCIKNVWGRGYRWVSSAPK